ncbi:MAG: UDP-N-acetylmuramate dehydrogenase [Tannerellaceae bacterium]|jgi:UDP-N-acetylmuramate dehydrogenase|nr:UDP-N-acetylmuramate dehydrogenase [Tannerellaceae bacterium]
MRIEENFSLREYNTFKLNVKVRWFIEYENESDLRKILSDEYFHSLPCVHIGGGSNILFLNDYYNGIVLHSAMRGITATMEEDSSVLLRVAAGERWDGVVEFAVGNGWYGIENLSGIPGEAGGAAVQNIGAYGAEFADVLASVECFDIETGDKLVLSKDECAYGYRSSRFKDGKDRLIVSSATLRLQSSGELLRYGGLGDGVENMTLGDMRNSVLERRKNSLPDVEKLGNAGCFFVNPVVEEDVAAKLAGENVNMPVYAMPDGKVKLSAAWMIERCGFKGVRRGNVGISDKHALVAVNFGGADGNEIAALAEEIRQSTMRRFNVELKTEVVYIE